MKKHLQCYLSAAVLFLGSGPAWSNFRRKSPSIKNWVVQFCLRLWFACDVWHYINVFLIWFDLILCSCFVFTHADGSCQARVFNDICLFVHLSVFFHVISQKSMQLGSPNLTQKCSTMSPGNPFILGSKVKVTRHQCRHWFLHCWLLLVTPVHLRHVVDYLMMQRN